MSIEDVRAALYDCILRKRVLRPLLAVSAPLFIASVVVMAAVAVIRIDSMDLAAGLAVCFFAALAFSKGSYCALGWGFVILALPHTMKFLGSVFFLIFFRSPLPWIITQLICSAIYILLAVWSFRACINARKTA